MSTNFLTRPRPKLLCRTSSPGGIQGRTARSGRQGLGSWRRRQAALLHLFLRLGHLVDEVGPKLIQELGGNRAQQLPPERPVPGVADVQVRLGPRHADEEQPAFLFQLVLVAVRPLVGQQAGFEPDDEDVLELQPFGGVEGHQGDLAAGLIVDVGVAEQGNLLEIVHQRGIVRLLVVGGRRADQLLDVLGLGLALRTGGLERLLPDRSRRRPAPSEERPCPRSAGRSRRSS